MAKLDINYSESVRQTVIDTEKGRITDMYKRLAGNIGRQAVAMNKESPDYTRLKSLEQELKDLHSRETDSLGDYFGKGMKAVADSVLSDTANFFNTAGLSLTGLYSRVPDDAVKAILRGDIYKPLPNGTNWSLSGALWDSKAAFNKDIHFVIAEGMAQNRSTYAIAKDLEKYVNGSAEKDFDWGNVYPNTRKKVDYNAQRLARTLVAHAYQYTFVRSTHFNPFVEGYIWHSGHSDRTCEICNDRDGQFYEKGQLPLDHPNGLCYWEAKIPMSMTDVSNRIGDWANGKYDPELDGYFEFLYYDSQAA